ncbi:MAG: hypothetical protein ACXVCS_01430 [Bdellovibrionota bacterium]
MFNDQPSQAKSARETRLQALQEMSKGLSQISRALSQGHARSWVHAAAQIRESAVAAGFENLANRCRQLEEIRDVEHVPIAARIFEGIAEEFAKTQIAAEA